MVLSERIYQAQQRLSLFVDDAGEIPYRVALWVHFLLMTVTMEELKPLCFDRRLREGIRL